jgi:hypothetical protein
VSSSNGQNESHASGPEGGSELPHPIYNWMSTFGGTFAVCGWAAAIFFLLLGLVERGQSSYSGLLLLPPLVIIVLGTLLAVAGYLRERWRQKHGRRSSFFEKTVVDPWAFVRHRGNIALVSGVALVTFSLLVAGAGSMATMEYTESNTFCGEACHEVMSPEATVYATSPHAQIHCVECHVGSGGEGYIRAKIGGMRQVVSVATGQVERPIPTPIRHRQPSSDMCQSCHTKDRDIGYKAITRTRFLNEENSSPVTLHMMMKVGGGDDQLMQGSGIHDHMMLTRKVEYIARDVQRQDIPYVRVTDSDGEVHEYVNESFPLTDEEKESLELRQIECVDCHSRPAHQFPSAVDSVDAALVSGRISPKIPFIKEAGVRALDGGYATTAEALEEIDGRVRDFYEEEHPEVLENGFEELIEAGIGELRNIYQRTIFPEMKADWRAHPDNLGHRDSPGCFRCHNDEMVDEDGETIFTDCTKCHAILTQDEEVIRAASEFDVGRGFVHPEDGEEIDEFTLCSDCHTGGSDLYD